MTFTVSKKNGVLLFNNHGCYQSRSPSTFWCIQEADKIYNWPDFNDMYIDTNDCVDNNSTYSYSKINSNDNLVPEFNFHSWKEAGIDDYDKVCKEIDEIGKTPFLINKVGWIGSIKTSTNRKILYDIGNKNNDVLDIISMQWLPSNTIKYNTTQYLSLPELVKSYSILLDIEGAGFSARLKYLLWSHRPLLFVDRPYTEYFIKDMREWEHYIPVKRDLSDIIEKTNWCLNNYDKAMQIAENAYIFAQKYLTREACFKQWDTIISKHISTH